jgi:aspartate kinase
MLIVQKFGGTSVGSLERIRAVARRCLRTQAEGHQVVVVASAMAGETNRLVAATQEIAGSADPREQDVILATGEQVSVGLLALAIQQQGGRAVSLLGHQACIVTDDAHGKARIQRIDDTRIRAALRDGVIPVVAGFQGVNAAGDVTTLGRGGSDTTAVALAAALTADRCEIYTDVDGVYTTDPGVCPAARKLTRVSYEEMLELASLGAKVLQIRSVEFAMKYRVPLWVRSSFQPLESGGDEGTQVCEEDRAMEDVLVSGIAYDRNEARITLRGLPDAPGVAARIFAPLERANVVVDMIVQNEAGDGKTALAFTVGRAELAKAAELVSAVAAELGVKRVETDDRVAKVSVVGVGMRNHSGVAARMFQVLANEGINIQLISTSEIKISVVIQEKYTELAVRSLHSAFGLDAS